MPGTLDGASRRPLGRRPRATRWRRRGRRSTSSTSTRCPTATPAPTCYLTFAAARRGRWPRPARRRGDTGRRRPVGGGVARWRTARCMGARGNSGVILPSCCAALADGCRRRTARSAPASWPAALAAAPRAAYAAVAQPVEGTMLTVAGSRPRRPAAPRRRPTPTPLARRRHGRRRGRPRGAGPHPRAAEVLAPGRRRRRRRPRALVLLDALAAVVTGDAAGGRGRGAAAPRERPTRRRPRRGLDVADPDAHGPAYEVMYLLDAPADARSRRCARRSTRWATRWSWSAAEPTCGTCTCTSTTSAPRSRPGVEAGRPHRIRVTHFARRGARRRPPRCPPGPAAAWSSVVRRRRAGRAVRGGGATVVARRPGTAARRPPSCSTRSGAPGPREVVLLPNDARQPSPWPRPRRPRPRDEGLRVAVIPTRAPRAGPRRARRARPGAAASTTTSSR